MRARYYNPEIKRFINQDILTGSIGNHKSLNRYSYVQGNPVSYTDPFGLSPFSYISEPIHSVLSMAGCIPVIGNFFDGLNSVVYLMEGETEKAVLNLTSFIPGDKLGKYVVKNGKKIAATTAVTAVICQTDAGAGIKQGLNNAKNEIVEFYGLDDMSAADYVFMTLFGMQFAKGAKGGMLDIDIPTKKTPDVSTSGSGYTWKDFWSDNRGSVDLDAFKLNNTKSSSIDDIKDILKNGNKTSDGRNIISQLDDDTKIVFRMDVGENAHSMDMYGYSNPVNHINIEIQVKASSGKYKTKWNFHMILDDFGEISDSFATGIWTKK